MVAIFTNLDEMQGLSSEEFAQARKHLRKAETVVHGTDLQQFIKSEPQNDEISATRDYFFQAGVDEWYEKINQLTFRSEFILLSKEEAHVIIKNWKNVTSTSDESHAIPLELGNLALRIDDVIQNHFNSNEGVFVKLSTRSPKDSKTIFRNASISFRDRVTEPRPDDITLRASSSEDNYRMIVMSEEMLQSCLVHTGHDAVTILCDSQRVAEDLMYAYEEKEERCSDTRSEEYQISIVIRAWDSRVLPKCEFRGFVWDRHLNCLGQYWHSLFFPHLQGPEIQRQISEDCLRFFDGIKDSLPIPNAMLDLAWFGPGEVLLIEVNPLKEGLGSFRGSTGLFDFYSDETSRRSSGGEINPPRQEKREEIRKKQ
jgi:hypothetical protein